MVGQHPGRASRCAPGRRRSLEGEGPAELRTRGSGRLVWSRPRRPPHPRGGGSPCRRGLLVRPQPPGSGGIHGRRRRLALVSLAVAEPNATEPGAPAAGADFELLAGSLRSSSGYLRPFVEVLAEKLERALPGRVKVERRGARFLAKEKSVQRVECDFGERRYLLAAKDGAVETRRATAVRGVVLKSEALPLDDWIDGLARDLATEARSSDRSRVALEQLLKG